MSHLLTASVVIKDIAVLRAAAATFGAQFAEKKTFHSYQGETPCAYVIALPHVAYEVGVIFDPKTKSYSLSHDPYSSGSRHDGGKKICLKESKPHESQVRPLLNLHLRVPHP
jgi:hypothetical protein